MKDEKKVLGILSIVFGAIALVGSWVPFLNNGSFIVGLFALVLGVIALIVNRKNKKVLALIGTLLALASLVIVLATQSIYVSFLIYHNIDVVSIARLVGHKDATETLQTYAHLFERRQDEVFELVRKII